MGVCGNVCCVAAVVKDSVFRLGVLKYVVCLCKGCDGCFLFGTLRLLDWGPASYVTTWPAPIIMVRAMFYNLVYCNYHHYCWPVLTGNVILGMCYTLK